MSLPALLINDGGSWKNLYLNSVFVKTGYLRVCHCVTWSCTGGIGPATILQQTGGLTVNKNATGSYTVNWSALGLTNVPWAVGNLQSTAAQLDGQLDAAATTVSCSFISRNNAGVATDPQTYTMHLVENG